MEKLSGRAISRPLASGAGGQQSLGVGHPSVKWVVSEDRASEAEVV